MKLKDLLDDPFSAHESAASTEWLDSSLIFHVLSHAKPERNGKANGEASNQVQRFAAWRSCIDAIEARSSFQRLPHDERLEQQDIHNAICFLGSVREERSAAGITKRAALVLAAEFNMGRLKNRLIYAMINRLCDEAVKKGFRVSPLGSGLIARTAR